MKSKKYLKIKKVFKKDGKNHRLDGPAVIYTNDSKEYWVNGQKHCSSGPACIYKKIGKEWWFNGQKHRIDDPAIELEDGTKEYWVNGKKHRENEPAVIFKNGRVEYWINGQKHKVDGPAIYAPYKDGSRQEWWINGLRHRIDGPAIDDTNRGVKEWHIDGQRHRLIEPAVEYEDGTKEWWENGFKIGEHIPPVDPLEVWRKDGGNSDRRNLKIDENGIGIWYTINKSYDYHHTHIESCSKTWFRGTPDESVIHNMYGPAIEILDLSEEKIDFENVFRCREYIREYDIHYEWWINDEPVDEDDHPFNIFRRDYRILFDRYSQWTDDMKMLYKLIYSDQYDL